MFHQTVAEGTDIFREALDRIAGLVEVRVGERCNQAVRPIQAVRGDFRRGVAQVGGGVVDIRIERGGRGERAGTVRNPHDRTAFDGRVRANLHGHHVSGAVDADRTVAMAAFLRSLRAVRVVRGTLVMRPQQEVDVLDGHGILRFETPWNVVRFRGKVFRVGRIEIAVHIPSARRVVDVVLRGGGAEYDARVAVAAVHAALRTRRAPKMVRFDEFLQIGATHEFTCVAEGVIKIEIVDAKLVGNNRAFVVRNTAGDPMVSTDGFDVPDFVHIRNDDAVRFVRPVCFEQFSEALHTFARGVDVRQHEGDDVLFADAAWGFRLTIGFVGRLQCDQRVGAEYALVDGDGFGGAHGHVAFVDASFRKDSTIWQHVRHDAVSAWIVGKVDFDVAEHAAIVARLLLRRDSDEFLRIVTSRTGVVISGDDGRTVVTCFFAYKNCGT